VAQVNLVQPLRHRMTGLIQIHCTVDAAS
jgi:hypothetical protein